MPHPAGVEDAGYVATLVLSDHERVFYNHVDNEWDY